jgi:biotin transport system substrate-specific component
MEALLSKELACSKTANRIIGVTLFVLLTGLGAFVRIPLPFTPVPLTLQTFFVLLSGAFLGPFGAVSQIIYLLLGISGLSIFVNGGSGLLYLCGPTGGYLLGFIFASLFIAKFLKNTEQKFIRSIFIFLLADAILLLSGTLWLALVLGLSFQKAILIGFLPFVPIDSMKVLAAAWAYSVFKKRARQIF